MNPNSKPLTQNWKINLQSGKPIIIFSYLIILIILSMNVLSLGIAPGTIDIDYGFERSEQMMIINNEAKDMQIVLYAEGELSEYVELSTNLLTIKSNEQTKPFTVNIKQPKLDKPGKHEIKLIAMEIQSDQDNKGTVIATRQAVISKININVPYPGKYAEASLVIPKPSIGQPINFVVKIKNQGVEKIDKAQARIEIYSPTNEVIASLQTDQKSVNPKEMREVVATYLSNNLNEGKYYVKAYITYDSKNIVIDDTFEIGNLMVAINNIYTKEFRLGEIAKFDILVENKWNEPIADLYADMEIKDKYGKSLTQFKTAEKDVPPQSIDVLEAYWDTSSITIGEYKAKVTLHFLGNNIEKTINLFVRDNAIDIDMMPTGQVTSSDIEKPTSSDAYIILLIVISMMVNAGLVVYFMRKKKN